MEKRMEINGGFYVCQAQATQETGVATLKRWLKKAVTGYGYPLKTVQHRGHPLIEERDVLIVAAVQKDFPVPMGRIPIHQREQMKRYADRLHAEFSSPR